jgi:hypothetical protein
MNARAERFVRNARHEALDYFIILSRKQLKDILAEYIYYYNMLRPHQGTNQEVPKKYNSKTEGKLKKWLFYLACIKVILGRAARWI